MADFARAWKLLIPALAAGLIAAAWFLLPAKEWLGAFIAWIRELGAWGYVLYAAVYVVATVLAAPTSVFTIAAGFLFGVTKGLLIVMVGATVGAALAFLVSRYLLRGSVKALIKRRPRFEAVDRAVAHDGWKIALLLHLSPLVPFNLQNYVFGASRIRFWPYVAACVGIVPGVLVYLYLGAIGGALAGGDDWSAAHWTLFAMGLAATAAATWLVTRRLQLPRGEDARLQLWTDPGRAEGPHRDETCRKD